MRRAMDSVINIMNRLFCYILEQNQVSVCLMNLLAYLCCDDGDFFLTIHGIEGSSPISTEQKRLARNPKFLADIITHLHLLNIFLWDIHKYLHKYFICFSTS